MTRALIINNNLGLFIRRRRLRTTPLDQEEEELTVAKLPFHHHIKLIVVDKISYKQDNAQEQHGASK